MSALPAVHAVCGARYLALHNRVFVESCRASGSFTYPEHRGSALAALPAGRRPAVLHRDLLGLLNLSGFSALQAVSGHRQLLLVVGLNQCSRRRVLSRKPVWIPESRLAAGSLVSWLDGSGST